MSSSAPRRPALGHMAPIGTLYNARTETFLPMSLINSLSDDVVIQSNVQRQDVHINYVDTYGERFKNMGLSTEMSASALAGMVQLGGSGRYLGIERESNRTLQAAIYHKITTVHEKLNMMSSKIQENLASPVLRTSEVTHVVTGIEWGCQTVVMARARMSDNITRSAMEPDFRAEIENFKSAVENSESLIGDKSAGTRLNTLPTEFQIYSDMQDQGPIPVHDFQNALNFVSKIKSNINTDNDGKGKPVCYVLMPVGLLPHMLSINIQEDMEVTSPSIECLQKFVNLFDQFRTARQLLNDYRSYIDQNKLYIGDDHLRAVADHVRGFESAENNLKSSFAGVLQNVKLGAENTDRLWRLLEDSDLKKLSTEEMSNLSKSQTRKVEFIKKMVILGATYIGYNGLDSKSERLKSHDVDRYLFFFSEAAMHEEKSWNGNHDLFLELFHERNRNKYMAIVDCDATRVELNQARVAHFMNQKEVTNDLFAQREFLADKCFARYLEPNLDQKNVQKPLKRRFVKIPCPGPHCNPNKVCDWICVQCHANIEYGYSDDYIYCDCGRSLYDGYDFNCNSDAHGTEFFRHESEVILSLLKSLTASDYLNILILGETGVGKSTFINAFINYLSFETLDEAMKAEELISVIPCTFSTQIMDRSNPDSKIQQIKIKVGSRSDERDGSTGQSATQRTSVYSLAVGTTTIRLIDTPGIGDTRGVGYDRKNMSDILSTLNGYEDLHGILILLKSNNSRLNLTFRFCVKELLTHLHRSAARNMTFGFTNTRISNYTPGDTFEPLSALLKDHPDVGLELTTHTTYCFDSESFRFLAAYKNGVTMDNIQDFRRSWESSRAEAERLLSHFKSQTPHAISSTISLNNTRKLISDLTKPMAEISQLIRTNIALGEDQVKELKDTRLSGDKLRKRLHLQIVQLKPRTLNNPRTVCCNTSCTEYKDDGNGENVSVTVYKTHCHPICYLTDVRADQIAHPGLIHCAAFQGSQYCITCDHQWNEHMHVLYELEEYNATVKDTEIEKQLKANADDVTLKQTAIKTLEKRVNEYKGEHAQIQRAAAQFGLYLKKYSITPYNDAMLEYLDFLIKEEKGKVQAGGSARKLRSLENDRAKHEEIIEILTLNMERNRHDPQSQPLTEEGVGRVVRQLYNLRHFGKNLQKVQQTISAAHEATYREMPFRVKSRGNTWSTGLFQKSNSSTGGMKFTLRPRAAEIGSQGKSGSVFGLLKWGRN